MLFTRPDVRPYEVLPVPETANPRRIAALLDWFASTSISAVVVRQLTSDRDKVMDLIEPRLPANLRMNQVRPLRISRYDENDLYAPTGSQKQDFGLHVDNGTPHSGLVAVSVNYHYAESGSTKASFLPYKKEYVWERVRSREEILTEDDEADFMLGKVDHRKFTGKVLQTVTNPGDLLIFIEGLPVAHKFDSLELPRESSVFLGGIMMDDALYGDKVPKFHPILRRGC